MKSIIKDYNHYVVRLGRIRGYLGLDLSAEVKDGAILVTIGQLRGIRCFSEAELIDRAKDLYETLDYVVDLPRFYRAIPYVSRVDLEYIAMWMQRKGLRNKDLARDLNIDKCTISSILSGRKELTKVWQALFYYYFNAQ